MSLNHLLEMLSRELVPSELESQMYLQDLRFREAVNQIRFCDESVLRMALYLRGTDTMPRKGGF